jgi:hypothetical protein
MSLMLGALYDALRRVPDIPEEVARKAAEEVAKYEGDMGAMKADLLVIKWMLGFVLAGVLALLLKAIA